MSAISSDLANKGADMNVAEQTPSDVLSVQSSLEVHMLLVQRVARKVYRDLGLDTAVVELDDLVQFGYVGMLEARERFEHARGTDFRWYAHRCVQGAILDGLRTMTRLPRRMHRLLRLIHLAQDDTRRGDGLEAALDAGCTVAGSGFIMMQSPYPSDRAPDLMSPEELAHEKLRAERVRMLIEGLPELDREVAKRHCFDGQPLSVVASALGISRPWAWRVLARATHRITLSFAASSSCHELSAREPSRDTRGSDTV